MDDFERASARLHRLARALERQGIDLGIIADALAAEALAAFSAHHGMPETARGLAAAWAELRETVDG